MKRKGSVNLGQPLDDHVLRSYFQGDTLGKQWWIIADYPSKQYFDVWADGDGDDPQSDLHTIRETLQAVGERLTLWATREVLDVFYRLIPEKQLRTDVIAPLTLYGCRVQTINPKVRDVTAEMGHLSTIQRMASSLQAVLLFHRGGVWDDDARREWKNLTGRDDASTKSMCDTIRETLRLAGYPRAAEGE